MTVDDLRPPSSHLVVGDTCPGTTCFTCPGTTCLAATDFGFTYNVAQEPLSIWLHSTPERQPGNRPPPTTASSTQVPHANPEGHTGDYPQPAKQPPVPPRHWRYPAQDCLAFRDHSAPGAMSPESTRRRLMRTRDSDVCGTMIIGGATIKRHSKPWAWPPCPVPGMPDPKSPCMWKFHPHRSVRSHDPPSQYEDMISRGLSHSRQGIAHRC
ncbi:hypothetical protein Bbelb_252340 [Branchiostoma belcheri]|nr:hypothetical protein Bbelb_252340 [Branchiostoma belcheri]